MRTRYLFLVAPLVVACAPAAVTPGGGGGVPQLSAEAEIRDREGRHVGSATLTDTPHGVLIWAELFDLPDGRKAMHVHAAGRCDPPDFMSAEGHFNPHGRQHGILNPAGMHAGDLPNVHLRQGRVTTEVLVRDVTLRPGPASLLREGGTSLMIHDGEDDYVSDPAGNAGARIACGVIRPSS